MAGEEACLGLGEPRGGTSRRIFASMLWKSLCWTVQLRREENVF